MKALLVGEFKAACLLFTPFLKLPPLSFSVVATVGHDHFTTDQQKTLNTSAHTNDIHFKYT